jgi:alanyl-tRNA synthetase
MSSVNEIRTAFLNYFARAGHEIVPSSPLVPRNDPTLMFTNAGMVQFKNVFTGLETRPYNRAVTSQKCVRAGGKHNDLDNVGYTARHHTFFEMLGNFSFGDYFKDQAIEFAWNLITKEFGLPKDRLLATVYAEDDEAFALWRKIAGLPEERIIRIPTSDNFWAMGDTGPCGPCSEIFFDHGPGIAGGPPGSPDEDGDRFIEIWNLVFMQYEQVTPDERVALPKPSIDTGMGLERIAAVLQGKHDNYDIDLMRSLILASADATRSDPDGAHKVSHRVIADHLRASSFLIADGVLPSNEGRGYVLRRIMRRAMRHAELIGVAEPVMWKLVPTLVREMGDAYPELRRAQAMIEETLRLEEGRFRKTLVRGLQILSEESQDLGQGATLSGEVAFKLYDTYGFPLDLTEDALRSRGITIDRDGFNAAMERQRADARAAWAGSGEAQTEGVWFAVRDEVGATDFLGYETEHAEGLVRAIVKDGARVDTLKEGEVGAIVLNQTPFYGESGGQVGDTGTITTGDGAIFRVRDTSRKLGDVFVHYGELERGTLRVGDEAELTVENTRRGQVRSNHSATHILHEALRQVLGDHVAQKGSLVAPDRLRFDFSHPKPLTPEELQRIEDIANAIILQNEPVTTRLMSVDEAIEAGARALFGEKYGDEVRVVSMGRPLGTEGANDNRPYSLELCGGTHVMRTGDIGLLTVVSESAVGSGVRRIEALTGEGARRYLEEQQARLKTIAAQLKVSPAEAEARIAQLLEERRQLEAQLTDARRRLAMGGEGGASPVREAGNVRFMARRVEGIPARELKGLVDQGKREVGSGVVAIVGVGEDGKAGIVVGVTDDLTDRLSAVDLVRLGAEALGGKGGGGRPDMAQAGGPEAGQAEAALQAIEDRLRASA